MSRMSHDLKVIRTPSVRGRSIAPENLPGVGIPVCEFRNITLRFRSRGRLLPWIGPALRGLTNQAWKHNLCLQPDEELALYWKHCHWNDALESPCPLINECLYGQTFEYFGHPKLVLIAPDFPLPVRSRMGTTAKIKLLCIGGTAIQFAWKWLDLLSELGQKGLGDHGLKFLTDVKHCERRNAFLTTSELQYELSQGSDTLRRVQLRLTAPLFLRQRVADRRGANRHPSFRDLFSASDGLVRALTARLGIELPSNTELLERAKSISNETTEFQPFEQNRRSSRGALGLGDRFEMRGVIGAATFRDVPCEYLPWLQWAGRLHTGMHRSAGAGSWDVSIE